MLWKIKIMKLKNIERGDKVVYIPKHMITADANGRLADENLGVVTSVNDTYAFVRFIDKTGSQAVRPEDLYTLQYRQDLADKIDDLPTQTF